MYQNEKILETKICKHCSSNFEVTDRDMEFYEKISPVFDGKKYLIPMPTLCPECRQQSRLCFKNERKLYKRKCDLTGKDIISIISPDKLYKVYEQKEWWSDKWNALGYGRDFDFNKTFFEQFGSLVNDVPKFNLFNINCENSEFNHALKNSRNCYLCFGCTGAENALFVSESGNISNSLDILWSYTINNCYEINNSDTLNSCIMCDSCSGCSNCLFCSDCKGCSNCLFCYGLNNCQYYIFNKSYTKEEYFEKLKEFIDDGNYFEKGKKILKDFLKKKPHKMVSMSNNENSNGDYIYNTLNVTNGFNVVNVNNGKNIYECGRTKDIFYCSYVYDSEGLIINSIDVLKSFNVIFSNSINNSSNIYYSDIVINSSNLFGCVGLNNKQYCILNKQYTKEEYEKLVPKIIEHMRETGEWGEFFTSNISPFGYNETLAQEYFPLTKEDAIKQGFKWSDYETPFPKVEKIIPANKLPYNIKEIPDDILNWAIECEVTNKPFRIVKGELDFYRKHNLPIPKRHPDQRHSDRMALRNPRKLYNRKCDKCGIDIKTTYAPDREEIVYCEDCYNKEVY